MNLSLLTSRLQSDYPVLLEPEIEPHPQTAAVLVLLYTKNARPHVLLIKRAASLPAHAGEIAFPGGVFQPDDESLLTTALRETEEEVGLELAPECILGRLPTVLTLTEFQVSPFVARLDSLPKLKANPEEVDAIIEAPLVPLLSTQQPDIGYRREMDMWVYLHGAHRIWGATARILHQLSVLL